MDEQRKVRSKRPEVVWLVGAAIVMGVLIVAGAIWYAISSSGEGDALGEGGKPLLVVSLTGGLCAEGVTCKSEHPIGVDGSFVGFDSLTDSEVAELKQLIKESRLRELKETDTKMCASYYDGADVGIRVPSWGEEIYTPCLLLGAEDDKLVVFVEELLS